MHERGFKRRKLASIPKFGLEIKNRCTQESVNRQKLASIRKSGLEIKNRCIGGGGGVLQAGYSSLRQRKLESEAELVVATVAAGETILLRGDED